MLVASVVSACGVAEMKVCMTVRMMRVVAVVMVMEVMMKRVVLVLMVVVEGPWVYVHARGDVAIACFCLASLSVP